MRELWTLLKTTWRAFLADGMPAQAAAIAYYAALSLGPLVLLALRLASAVGARDVTRAELVRRVHDWVGGPAGAALESLILAAGRAPGDRGATVFGAALLLVSGTAVFAQLQATMNVIWRVEANPRRQWLTFLRNRLLSITMLLLLGALMLASVLLSAGLQFAQQTVDGSADLWGWADFGVSLGIFAVLFAGAFKLLPDACVAWRDAARGGALTAVLFVAGKQVIGVFLSRAGMETAYGAAGALVLFLVWVYYTGLIVFFGAEAAWALASRGRRAGQPVRYARSARMTSAQDRMQVHSAPD